MIRGSTFNLQKLLSTDHALEVETYYNKREGIIRGSATTLNADGTLNIAPGYVLIKGRLIEFMGTTTVPVQATEASQLYSSLVVEIDMSKTNTQTELNQVSLKILTDVSGYPVLTKEDINFDGTIYQFEMARFINTLNGVTSLTNTAKNVSLASYSTKEETEALKVTDSISLPTLNGWGYYGGNYAAPRAYKNKAGMVWIDGSIDYGAMAIDTVIAQLPVGYRPRGIIRFSVPSHQNAALVLEIQRGGAIMIKETAAKGFIHLGGISFQGEN